MHTRETAVVTRVANSPEVGPLRQSSAIASAARRILEGDQHRIAVIDDRGNSLRRGQLWSMAGDVAAEMRSRGLVAGDIAIICMPNWTEWMVAYLGAVRTGLVPATLPVTTDPASIAYVANLVGAKTIVLPRKHRGRNFQSEATRIADLLGRSIDILLVDGDQLGRQWLRFEGAEPSEPAYPDGLAHILFSSSTTGKSKAIAHSEESLGAYNQGVIDRYGMTAEHPIFMPSPLGHSTGFWHGARMSLLTGAPLVLQDRWDAARALQLVDRYRCAITVAATPFLKDLVDVEWDSPTAKLDSMRVFLCGGAPVPPSVIQQAQEQMPGTQIASIWAMSEGGATSSLPDDDPSLATHSCGRVLPGVVLETIAPDGSIAPRGVEGEIVMRTPSLFLGYIGQDELYNSSFTSEGRFRTGDVGIVDEEGYLSLTGRLKDIIIRGGVNISPAEIENALSQHEDIAEIAVIGCPDDRLGERICAVVQVTANAPLQLDDLTSWLDRRGVPRRLWPESLVTIADMPRTPAGKIRKNELRQMITEETE